MRNTLKNINNGIIRRILRKFPPENHKKQFPESTQKPLSTTFDFNDFLSAILSKANFETYFHSTQHTEILPESH